MFSLALLFFISYCRVILPLCLPCWLLLQSLFPVHRQVPARNGQMYKRNHRLHLSWNEVWLHIRKSPVPEHLLLRWYTPVYPFIPSTRPRRLFRSPITSPVNLSGTRICIFTIGSNRTGEAARKPSLNAIFVAVLNAISEESTG